MKKIQRTGHPCRDRFAGVAILHPIKPATLYSHPVAGAQIADVVLRDYLIAAIFHAHGYAKRFIVIALAISDLISRNGAARCARDRCSSVAAAAADLMPDQTTRDTADYRAGNAMAVALSYDFDSIHDALGVVVTALPAIVLAAVIVCTAAIV